MCVCRLFCIGLGARCLFVGFVIKFYGSNDSGVLEADEKIEAHAIDSVVPLVKTEAFFHPKHSRELYLCQHNAFRHGCDEAMVEYLLWLRERPFCIERPWFIAGAGIAAFLENHENDSDDCYQNNCNK